MAVHGMKFSPFSQLIVRKIKLNPKRLEPAMYKSNGKYANHSATGAVRNSDEYLVYMQRMFNFVLRTCFPNILQLL